MKQDKNFFPYDVQQQRKLLTHIHAKFLCGPTSLQPTA